MRISTTGTSRRVPVPGGAEVQPQEPPTGRRAWVVRDGGVVPDVVLMGSGQQIAVAIAVAQLLARDGLATRVVAVGPEPPPSAQRGEVDEVAPPGVPRVTVCDGGCPETLEGIRLAAHDVVAAGTQGW